MAWKTNVRAIRLGNYASSQICSLDNLNLKVNRITNSQVWLCSTEFKELISSNNDIPSINWSSIRSRSIRKCFRFIYFYIFEQKYGCVAIRMPQVLDNTRFAMEFRLCELNFQVNSSKIVKLIWLFGLTWMYSVSMKGLRGKFQWFRIFLWIEMASVWFQKKYSPEIISPTNWHDNNRNSVVIRT